jgi:uncharacterized lipoprotein YmbA
MSGVRLSTPRPRRAATKTLALGVLGLALAACGSAGLPPITYVLGPAAAGAEGAEPLTGRPVIELKPVLVSDYLDVSDILVRRGENAVMPSPTGRWGERLSVGVTRALALGLMRRLPGPIVTSSQPAEQPARQILAEVETFEPRADGSVVLVARWRVLDGAGRKTLAGERVTLKEVIDGQGDALVVAAMTRAVEDFADHVAAGVRRTMPATGAGR